MIFEAWSIDLLETSNKYVRDFSSAPLFLIFVNQNEISSSDIESYLFLRNFCKQIFHLLMQNQYNA